MFHPKILNELLALFKRPEIPAVVRMTIAHVLGEAEYLPAKEPLIAGLSSDDPGIRMSCISALTTTWELVEVAPRLIEMALNDDADFVRSEAASGLGSLRYKPALLSLKRIILECRNDKLLQDAAYKAVLSILGKEEEDLESIGKPVTIDWDLVHSL